MATVAVETPHTNGFLDSVTTVNGDEVKEQTPFTVWDEHVEGKLADKAADVSTDDHIVTATEADDSAVPTSSTDALAQEIQDLLSQDTIKDTIKVKTFTEPQEADNEELNSDKLPISQDAAETTTEANVVPESTKEKSESFDSSIASELLDTPAEESNGPEPLLETVEPKSVEEPIVEDGIAPSVVEPPIEQAEETLAPTVTNEEAEEPVAEAEQAAAEAPVEQVEQTVAPVLTLQEDESTSAAPIPAAVDAPEVEEIASLPTTTEEAEPEAEVTADAPVDTTTGTEDEELPVEAATALETQDEAIIPPAAETTPLNLDIKEDSTAEVPTEVETKGDAAIEEAPISIEQPTSLVEEQPGVQEDVTPVVVDSDPVAAAAVVAEAEDAIAEPLAAPAEVEVESDVAPQEVVGQVPESTTIEEDTPTVVDATPVPAVTEDKAATEVESETVPVVEVEASEQEVVESETVVPEAAVEVPNVPEVAEEETPVAVDEPTPEEAHTVVAEPTLEAEAAPVIEDSEPVPVDEEVSGDVPTDTVPLAFEAGPVETPSVSAVADEEEARVVVDESEPVVEASEAVAELDAAPAVEAEVEPEPVTVEDEVIESEAIVHPTPEDEPTSVPAIADEEIPIVVAEPTPAALVVEEPILEAVAPVEEESPVEAVVEPPVETEVLANEPSLEEVPAEVASTPAELADDVEDKSTVVVEPSAQVIETPALAKDISEPEPSPVAELPVETTDAPEVAAEAPIEDPVVVAESVPEALQVVDNSTEEQGHVAEAEEVTELPDTSEAAQEVPVDAEVEAPIISDGAAEEVESVEVQSSVDVSVAADKPVAPPAVAEILSVVEEESVAIKEEEVEEPLVADTPAIEEPEEAPVVDVPVEIVSEITESVEEDVVPLAEQVSEAEETVAALVDDTAVPADEETSIPDVDIAPPIDTIVAEETAPFVEESTEALAEDEPVVPTIDEPSAEEIVTEVPSLSIDTAPETRSLSPASEIERPKSPWTPSYSVTSQGPGIAPEEDIPAIEEDISPPVEAPPSPIPEVAITPVDGSEPEALQAPLEDVVRPTSPWTPSYSVSVQGSPALKPIELDEPVDVEPLDSPSDDVPENSETQEINEPAELTEDLAPVPVLVEDVLAVEVPVTFAPEVPAESEISEPRLLTPEPQTEIERPASPWTPSYSVSQQGSTSTEALVPEEVDQEVAVLSPPVEEPVVQVTPAETEEEEEPETKVSDIQLEIERPVSPWIPSYTVTRSTEDLTVTETTEDEDAVPAAVDVAVPEESSAKLLSSESPAEVSRPASPWTPSYSVNQQGSKSSEALDKEVAAEEEPIVTVDEPIVNVVDTTPEDASKEDAILNVGAEIPRPWTPSYSVNQQGSGASTPAVEKEANKVVVAAEAPAVVEPEANTEPSVELETQTPEALVVEETPLVSEDAPIVDTEKPELSPPAEIERPWTPSYSVIQQGSATPQPQTTANADVDEEEQMFEDVQESAPAPVESLTAPLSLEVPAPGSPWTPSYSVTSQGPASPSLGNLPALDDETSREEAQATAEESDTLEPLPSSPLPGVAFPHSTTRDADLTSLDTISSQPAGGSEEKRKRIESTISTASSRFFPGGWFSKPSPTTEPRQSIESASGEFTPAKIDPAAPEGSGAHEPQADDSTDEDEDEDDEEIKDEKKGGRWCVVM